MQCAHVSFLYLTPLCAKLVGLGGFEPPTSPLSGVRSNQLSYRPRLIFSRNRNNLLWTLMTAFSCLCKEVIQPQVPLGLPCYDFTPVMNHSVVTALLKGWTSHFWSNPLPWCDGRCVQGPGTYSPRHSDPRLLAIPTSCSRVADCNPDWDRL